IGAVGGRAVGEESPVVVSAPLFFRIQKSVSVYRTSNQAYGSRAPTVHEMPRVECSGTILSMFTWRKAL
ncbi:LOW QUALITY PROTEIN: C9orf116 isoform 4, partial [Pongo abelii]